MAPRAGRGAFRLSALFFSFFALAVFVLVATTALADAAPARSRSDVRIDAIAVRTLLQAPPRALVDPNRQREAESLAGYARPLFLLRGAAEILTLFLLWQTGVAARMRDALRRYFRFASPVRFFFGAAIASAALAAAFPFALWGHRIARIAQLTPERISSWAEGYLAEGLLIAIGVGLIAAIVLRLVQALRTWYLVVAVGVCAFTIGFAALAPALQDAVARPTAFYGGRLEPRLAALELRAGLPQMPIVVERVTDRTKEANAHVEGVGPFRRIALDDTLVASATDGELLFAVAHELAHGARNDELRLALALALLVIVATALAVTVTDRIGFRRDDDELVRLTLVAACIGIAYLALLPGYNAYVRSLETRADLAAVALTGDKAGAIRSFVRFVDDEVQPLCPPRAVRLYLYDHEAYGTRIAALQGRPSPCR